MRAVKAIGYPSPVHLKIGAKSIACSSVFAFEISKIFINSSDHSGAFTE